METKTMNKYNGYSNYHTWNIVLWLLNDEGLYYLAKLFTNYLDLANDLKEQGVFTTPDNVSYLDPTLDHEELNSLLNKLQE
jgi:hypothetical protein